MKRLLIFAVKAIFTIIVLAGMMLYSKIFRTGRIWGVTGTQSIPRR